jgi:hypothetical protein
MVSRSIIPEYEGYSLEYDPPVPVCLGRKKCPLNNRNYCNSYWWCLDVFIEKKLKMRWSIHRIRAEIKEFAHGIPDYQILCKIGAVAQGLGLKFGRDSVDTAISKSNIDVRSNYPAMEKADVRRAFGVYGRAGSRAKKKVSNPVTEPLKTNEDASENA